jgi:hypothetical protein
MTRLPTEEFAAFVGIDWADAKHDVCIQAASSETREFSGLEHTPETIDAWVNTLRKRFKGRNRSSGPQNQSCQTGERGRNIAS